MKPRPPSSWISRRGLLATAPVLLSAMSGLLRPVSASAQTVTSDGLLPSWNDGRAKQAILDFVRSTTDPSSPGHVRPEDRIAVFDQDGTLWVEQPMYTQVVYCLERVPAVVDKKPELKNVEPFKTVLSGNREAMARLSMRDLEKILAATLTGMPVEQFQAEATKYGYAKDGKPLFLTKEPKLILNDNNAGKPEGIYFMIGRRPYAAF